MVYIIVLFLVGAISGYVEVVILFVSCSIYLEKKILMLHSVGEYSDYENKLKKYSL